MPQNVLAQKPVLKCIKVFIHLGRRLIPESYIGTGRGEDYVWEEQLLSVLCVGRYFTYAYSVYIYGEDLGTELLTYSLARNTSGLDLCLQ